MVFYATFNNISVISWQSVLLEGETGVPGENPKIHFYRSMLNFYHFQTIFYTLPSWTQPWTDVHIDYNTALFSETIWFKDWKPNYRASKVLSGFICCITHLSITHFQQYFSYIVAVSFIGGGNRSTWRKPPTCRESLTNFFTKCCIEYMVNSMRCSQFIVIDRCVMQQIKPDNTFEAL
jgi:hypothetical protein